MEVTLERGPGTPGRGAGSEGEYWHVFADGRRAGKVFVNVIDEEPYGRHASIQIFLNQASQGRGIGSIAYRLAAEASRHDPLYAHMRRSNVASRKAAERAGFVEDATPGQRQLTMIRKRR